MKRIIYQLCIIAAFLILALKDNSTSQASTTVFNNIAPTTPYYSNFGAWLGTFGQQYAVTATSFTPSASGQLDELALGLFYQTGQNSVTLRLSPDTLGLPGAPIWQTTVAPAPGYGFLLNVTGINGPMLNAGQQYWLEGVAPITPATLHGWYTNNQGDVGSIIAAGNFIPTTQRYSLRVGVLAAVPEPTSCFLLMCGLFGFALTRGRRSERSC